MVRFDTQLIHGVDVKDNDTGAVNPPIYNSSTFAFKSVDDAPRWDYARSGNPTREFLERQIAQLEHGARGFAFASGLAAIHAVLSIFEPGDRIIVGDDVYGGTYSQINEHFHRWGILFDTVNTADLGQVRAAFERVEANGGHAKAIYFEGLTNPLLKVNDVERIAAIAHEHRALVFVDNTFVTPLNQRPLDLGADLVLHSATKYLAGHSDVIAGLTVVKNEDLGNRIYFALNRLGGILPPLESDLVRRGLQTLSVRLERQQRNALKVARWLESNPLVDAVHYPGLASSPYHDVATRVLNGTGGVLSFEVRQGIDPADVLNNLRIFRLAVSLGAVESLAEYPARMTHFEVPREKRLAFGITDELIRLSIGLENVEDLIDDLDGAFAVAVRNEHAVRSTAVKA